MYSHVDTVLTPSLIDISPIRDLDIPQGVMQPMGSDTQINISPTPGVFPSISNTTQSSYLYNSDRYAMMANPPPEINIDQLPSSPLERSSLSLDSRNGGFPSRDLENIPGLAPAKNINVDAASTITLKEQLKHKDVLVRETALKILEKRIIMMQGKCPDNIVDNLRVRIFQLDTSMISNYLNDSGRYDHSYQDGMGCLIDALISNDGILPDIRLRRWITDINRVGGASAEGMAFKLESSSYPLYVIKVAADADNDTLPHEALVGMGALNKLRDRVPTFMHTYGAFMCAPPVLNSEGQVISWCPSKTNSITYLVLENIQDAVSLKSLAWDLNDSEFLQIYLQILNALNVAYQEFDFTHYDLHDNNVLIQILPYYVSVPLYLQDGGIYYIKTRHLARIIDYGMSHIYLQGQHFGKYNLEYAGVDAESSFPMHDAYKILLFTYASSLQRNSPGNRPERRTSSGFSNVANGIYQFFNENKTIDTRVIERQQNSRGDYYQPSESYKNITFDDIISFIISSYQMDFITSEIPIDTINTVCNDICLGWNEFTQHVFSQSRLPTTLEDYCQAEMAIDNLSNNRNKSELQKWIRQFNVENAYNSEKDTILNKLNTAILELNNVSLLTTNVSSFNYETYKQNLQILVRIRSQLLNVQIWIAATVCAFNRKSILSYISDDIKQILKGLNEAKARLIDYQNIIKFNMGSASNAQDTFTQEIDLLHDIIMTPI